MTQPTVIENFATNTGQFVVIGGGSVGPSSFVFAGGQGTFSNPGGRDATNAYNTNMPVSVGPGIFVYAVIGTPIIPVPSAGSYTNICAGIYKDASNQIMIEFGSTSNPAIYDIDILFFGPGGQHNLTTATRPTSSPPEAIGFSLQGNIATTLARYSGVWQVITSFDVSAIYDFTAPGAVTGWYAGAGLDSDGGGSIAINELWSGPPIVVEVPNVVGEDFTTASADITSALLNVGAVTSVADPSPPGTILSQNPVGGTFALNGANVDLVQSLGVPVPDVVNTSATVVAPGIITGAGFVVGTITRVADVLTIAGNVISQNPAAGANAAAGSPINLVVSTGRAGLFVPDVTGDTLTDATTDITNVGLVVNTVTYAPSLIYPAGQVMAQNPAGGTPVAYGSNVGVIISLGIPTVDSTFDFEATVISQYANSPTILQLVASMNGYIDQTQNFANFYNFVWNVDTAEGFGLDTWGHIVNVSRLLQIPTGARYVGFQDGTGPGIGTDVEPFSAGGSWYTPISATTAYLLEDEPYRKLILTKAMANIVNTTVPAFNQLLQNLFPGRGNPYVTTSGVMAMTFWFDFHLTPIELAILEQSGAVPVPPGVSFTIVAP